MKNKSAAYTQPPVPESGYKFVVAGCLYKNYGGLCVYVKYKGGDPHRIYVKDIGRNHIWYVCPDRELVIVRNSFDSTAFYPWGDSFDEVWDLNLLLDRASKDIGIDYVMTNFAHVPGTEQHPRLKSSLPQEKRINVLSDSGGLQIARGVSALIHPRDLIAFYNQNADAGMCLDVPVSVEDRPTLIRAAKLQKANSDLMIQLSKGTELINIFHGHTAEDRKIHREITEDKRINRVAIPGLNRQSLLTGISEVYNTIHLGTKRYKQYHALGVFSSSHIPLFVKMANSGENPVHITSDSTSHIQSARNGAYHFQFDLFSTSKRLPIGTRGSFPNTMKLLPCQCAVCRVLKYTDILAFGTQRYSMELLSIHNALEMVRYTAQLQEAAQSMSDQDYNKIVELQLNKHPHLKMVKAGLDFIAIVNKEGLKAAQKKYSFHINKQTTPGLNSTGTLFGEAAATETQETHTRVKRVIKEMERNVHDWDPKTQRTKRGN